MRRERPTRQTDPDPEPMLSEARQGSGWALLHDTRAHDRRGPIGLHTGGRVTDETKEPGIEVAKYDRAMLERHEVQPISSQDGHTIVVDSGGYFGAKVGDVEIRERTMEKVRERIHKTHMAQERRRKKKKIAAPCYVYLESGADRYIGPGFFRGVHAGNGDYLFSRPDGTTGRSEHAVFFPKRGGGETVDRLRELFDERARLQARIDEIDEETGPLVKAQTDAMEAAYKAQTRHYRGRYIRNNQEAANDLAESVLAVLKVKGGDS